MRECLLELVETDNTTEGFARLACGRVSDCFFGKQLRGTLERIRKIVERAGHEPRRKETDTPSSSDSWTLSDVRR